MALWGEDRIDISCLSDVQHYSIWMLEIVSIVSCIAWKMYDYHRRNDIIPSIDGVWRVVWAEISFPFTHTRSHTHTHITFKSHIHTDTSGQKGKHIATMLPSNCFYHYKTISKIGNDEKRKKNNNNKNNSTHDDGTTKTWHKIIA